MKPSRLAALALAASGGLAVLMAGLVGGALLGPTPWVLGLLLAGCVAAVLGGIASWRVLALDLSGSRRRVGAVVVLVMLLGVCEWGAAQIGFRLDVTSARVNTLSDESRRVARSVAEAVVIRAYLEASDRAWAELEPLAARYHAENGRIRIERVSPAEDPEGARRARVDEGGARVSLLVRRPDGEPREVKLRFDAGALDQEEQLTNGLRRLLSAKTARIYFLAGHGEADLRDEGPRGLSSFREALLGQGIEAVPLPLSATGVVPADAAAVAIIDPTAPIPPQELVLLKEFTTAGGSLMLAVEPGGPVPELLLAGAGITLDDDVVLDPSTFSMMLGGPETVTGVGYVSHAITRPLGTGLTHFLRARSLQADLEVGASPLVQSGEDAWGERTLMPGVTPKRDDGDVAGPINVAAVYEGQQPRMRTIVFGDATFLENRGVSLGSNRDLALNAGLFALEDEEHIAVRPNRRGGNLIFLSPTQRERLGFFLLVFCPWLFGCVGIVVRLIRRSR